MSASTPRVAVVGAGVVGLSVAMALARHQADVTVFERDHIGAGTSSKTFAWVNSNGKKPESYHRLNCAGMAEHSVLQRLAAAKVQWLEQTGTYEWADKGTKRDLLQARVASLESLQYPVERVSQRVLSARLPELRLPSDVQEIWSFPSEAVAHTAPLMGWLWSEARSEGASLREQVQVRSIQETGSGAVLDLSDGSRWEGDYVVLATGRWTPELTEGLGATLAMVDPNRKDKRACGFLAVTNPLCIQLRANLITPGLNIRPDGGGRLLLQATDLDERADPSAPASPDGYVGQEILSRLRRLFTNTANARIEHLHIGQRSRPADGLPAVGFLTEARRAYVVATHSGITLGPVLGRLIAEELVIRRRDRLLDDYAPQRLINQPATNFAPVASTHFPAEQ